jgi:hypothetical protein
MPNLAEWSGFAVAVGTGALAVSTWRMARAAGAQAKETGRLAEIAELQLGATALPELALSEAAPAVLAHTGSIVVTVRNLGATSARIESARLAINGTTLAGQPFQDSVGSDEYGTVEFSPTSGPMSPDVPLRFSLDYMGPGSGVRLQLFAELKWRNGELIAGETRTRRLGQKWKVV